MQVPASGLIVAQRGSNTDLWAPWDVKMGVAGLLGCWVVGGRQKMSVIRSSVSKLKTMYISLAGASV
jgi:hypothetical protein